MTCETQTIKSMLSCVQRQLDEITEKINDKVEILQQQSLNDDWQQVIDGKYACGFGNRSQCEADANSQQINMCSTLKYYDSVAQNFSNGVEIAYSFCAIRRVEGERQPHFGRSIPDIPENSLILVKCRNKKQIRIRNIGNAKGVDWIWGASDRQSNIIEFVYFTPEQ